jgi:hypothetical protein
MRDRRVIGASVIIGEAIGESKKTFRRNVAARSTWRTRWFEELKD